MKKAIKSGDEQRIRDAFERLYDENVRFVYRVLIDSFGKDDETDDDVQESFLALISSPWRLLSVERITEYWAKSAKYICGHRKERRNLLEEPEIEPICDDCSIPELVQGKELFSKIEEWLGHPDSDIVTLRAAYGYSEREIAQALGLGDDAVSYRYRKGIAKVREKLKNEEK